MADVARGELHLCAGNDPDGLLIVEVELAPFGVHDVADARGRERLQAMGNANGTRQTRRFVPSLACRHWKAATGRDKDKRRHLDGVGCCLMVEAAGIEPASASPLQTVLHT